MLERLIVSLAVAGFCISLYFSLVYYQLLKPSSRSVPAFCRMDDAVCKRILDAEEAKIFGIPNSILGLFYYSALLLSPIARFEVLFLIASAFSVGLGMYLTHALLVRLRTRCALCFTVHGINLLIANLLILRAYQV